jgi:hypothetical protein
MDDPLAAAPPLQVPSTAAASMTFTEVLPAVGRNSRPATVSDGTVLARGRLGGWSEVAVLPRMQPATATQRGSVYRRPGRRVSRVVSCEPPPGEVGNLRPPGDRGTSTGVRSRPTDRTCAGTRAAREPLQGLVGQVDRRPVLIHERVHPRRNRPRRALFYGAPYGFQNVPPMTRPSRCCRTAGARRRCPAPLGRRVGSGSGRRMRHRHATRLASRNPGRTPGGRFR